MIIPTSWTDRTVQDAIDKAGKADVWITDDKWERGTGSLRARINKKGMPLYYFRYTNGDGAQVQIPIEVAKFDESVDGVMGWQKALAKAWDWHCYLKSGQRDLKEHLQRQEEAEAARQAEESRQIEEAKRLAVSGSLEALCMGYVAHLERLGKASAKEARNLFKKHVFKAFPLLAASAANAITHKGINTVLAKLINDGKGRTAGKLRSYLRAAYAAATAAEYDPIIHPALHGFNLTANPVAAVPAKTLARYNKAGDRVLSESELRLLLAELKKQDTLAAEAVLLCLYLGGQRIAQTLRLTPADVDLEEGTVTLYDPKGARQIARTHVLPLNTPARAIVERQLAAGKPHLFAHDQVPLRPEKLSAVVTAISDTLLEAKAIRVPFHLKDVRRTAETLFARMGISSDVRAQLLSHGLGGVQQRHYNKHDYAHEKQAALDAWAAKLAAIESGEAQSNVVPLLREA